MASLSPDHLARFAADVTMRARRASPRSTLSQYLIDQIERTDNIAVRTGVEVLSVSGSRQLEAVTVRDTPSGEVATLPADAAFIFFIGAVPCSDIAAGLVERTAAGFILTGPDLLRDGRRPRGWRLTRGPFLRETCVPGIFAAGDVWEDVIRSVASAVGQGAVTVSMVYAYLDTV